MVQSRPSNDATCCNLWGLFCPYCRFARPVQLQPYQGLIPSQKAEGLMIDPPSSQGKETGT